MFILKILFAPVSLALTLFIWLCAGLISCSAFVVQAGERTALPAGGRGADYLLREKWHHSFSNRLSYKPPWIADAGRLAVGQAANCKCGNKKLFI